MSEMKNSMPQATGYYWAKWRIASEKTNKDLAETLPSNNWEIVEVNDNVLGLADETGEQNPKRFYVSVCGVTETQWCDYFIWGDFVAPLKPASGTHSSDAIAWASSKPYRKNHLMSAAQYNNALPKNRIDFDIPLFASRSDREVA